MLQSMISPEIRTSLVDILSGVMPPQRTRRTIQRLTHTLVQSPSRIVILLEMPGFTKDSIDVDFYNNQLNITGHKPSPVLLEEEKTLRTNIKYGHFAESVTLPVSVTAKESVIVDHKNGVLTITIDLVREEKNRFKINVGEQENSPDVD